jgi:pimeloyl-ACP methyl ester carboxylesterase
MHRAIPGSELAVIPGAGHLANVEQPDAFSQTVRAFLDRMDR